MVYRVKFALFEVVVFEISVLAALIFLGLAEPGGNQISPHSWDIENDLFEFGRFGLPVSSNHVVV